MINLLFLSLFFFALFAYPSADKDGIDAVKSWSIDLLSEAERTFASSGIQRYPSPSSWQSEVVYSIQIDRFNNGDPSNDNENLPPIQSKNAIHSQSPLNHLHEYRHGGDLQGIIDRLDYLQDLGVGTLWLTPVLKHNGDYHGYCTTNLVEIDPGFGDLQLFKTLVQEAHKRNIKIVMDIVINHLCDRATYYSQQPDHYKACNGLSSNNWVGGSSEADGQGELSFADSFFGPMKSKYFFNRAGPNSMQDMQGTDPPAVYGDFTDGMFDYNTRDYDFQEIFTRLMNYWIAIADVDGFRLDAAKHVTEDFLAYFSSRTRNYAESLGKNNFYIIGEVAGPSDWIGIRLGNMYSNPQNPNQHGTIPQSLTNRILSLFNDKNTDLKTSNNYLLHRNFQKPGLTAAYDFAHGGNARQTFRNEIALTSITSYFSSAYYQTIAAQSNPLFSWNVLEIHDWPRFLIQPFDKHYRRGILAYVYLATASGTPLLYYGQEQGFNQLGNPNNIKVNSDEAYQEMVSVFGSTNDALKRQDMFMGPWRLGSAVSEIDSLSYVGFIGGWQKADWRSDPFLQTNHDMYKEIKSINWLRKSCSSLREGAQYFRYGGLTTNKWGVFAYSRIYNGDEIVVIINDSDDNVSQPNILVDRSINSPDVTKFVNVKNRDDQGVVMGLPDGTAVLMFNNANLSANSYKVYVKLDNLGGWNDSIQGFSCRG